MKRNLTVLVILAASCAAPTDISVRILGASPLDSTCKVADLTVNQTGGIMNLALTSTYIARFATESDLQPILTQVGSSTLQGPGRNDFIGDHFAFSYTSDPPSSFPTELVPTYVLIPAGSTGTSSISTDLISAKASQALFSKVAPGSELTLNVTFQIQGHLFSGAPLKTNQVTFPISVFNQAPACAAPLVPKAVAGPCGNTGQDSLGFSCASPDGGP